MGGAEGWGAGAFICNRQMCRNGVREAECVNGRDCFHHALRADDRLGNPTAAEESETSSECVVQNSGLCRHRCWFVCLGGGALKMYEGVFFFFFFFLMSFFFFPERIERGIKSSRLISCHTMVSSTEAFNNMYHSDSLFSILNRAESHLCC